MSPNPRLPLAALLATLGLAGHAGAAPIQLDGPTTAWMAIPFAGLADAFDDSANPEADVVGDAGHSAVYVAFDGAGTPLQTDGQLAFRMRLGEDQGSAGFDRIALIGIDADLDVNMSVDLFIMVNFQGSTSEVQVLRRSGDGITPATTSVSNIGTTWPATTSNVDWSPVDNIIDPTATDTDLDNDGTDHFISWSVDFQAVVDELSALGIGGFTQTSQVRFIAGTSTNAASSLNQDIVGTDATGIGSSTPWGGLGAFSPILVVPEPSPAPLVGIGVALLAARRRAHRRAPRR